MPDLWEPDLSEPDQPRSAGPALPRSAGPALPAELDPVVVGAGFAGLRPIHRLRGAGRPVAAFETVDDGGGTWSRNRSPGVRSVVAATDCSSVASLLRAVGR